MLRIKVPRNHFWTSTYAHLDPDAEGKVIPIGYGTLLGLEPVEIDTTIDKFKLLDSPLSSVTRIASAAKDPLVSGIDFTADLPNAEFTLLKPVYLDGATTYYVAVEADYPESGTNYVGLKRNNNSYAYGTSYTIDSGGAWTPDVDDYDLLFTVYGKQSAAAAEEVIATNTTPDGTGDVGLKDSEPNTRVGFSFRPTVATFVTRIVVYITKHGTTTGYSLRVNLYSDTSGSQLGPTGNWVLISSGVSNLNLTIPERNENEDLVCDVVATGNQVDDILYAVMVTHMGKASTILDATALAALGAAKTQVLKLYHDSETSFSEVLRRLEQGQLWKLVPKMDGTYEPTVFAAGEPAGTPHFYDEDFLGDGLRVEYDVSRLSQKFAVNYDEDPETHESKKAQADSDVARLFYFNEETLSEDTYLTASADAASLASSRRAMYEVPRKTVTIEVHGYGLNLVPGKHKFRLTSSRGPGGAITGELYRIFMVIKRPGDGTVELKGILDTQTY